METWRDGEMAEDGIRIFYYFKQHESIVIHI